MRMDEMNTYFESKGFEVERLYNKASNSYRFIISKNENVSFDTYKWPADQQKFMDQMVKNFNKKFPNSKTKMRCKDFLIWCDRRLDMMNHVMMMLNDRKISFGANKHNGTIETQHVFIKFTNNKAYVEQDGLNWDEIFVDTEDYPDVLDYRTDSGVWHGGDLLGAIIDQVCKTEDQFRPTRNDGISAYAVALAANDFINNYKESVKREEMIHSMFNKFEIMPLSDQKLKPQIKNVIFNDPATIVMWTDGTKTVVKCQDDDVFDSEKGLAMAISKKALGNKREYYHTFLHWLKKYQPKKYLCMYCGADTTNPAWDHACDECSDDSNKEYNPVQLAYEILVKCRDHNVNFDIDDIIGYLGEALED